MSVVNIKDWFEVATPEPVYQNFNTQVGVHYEEVGEMTDQLVGEDAASEARTAELRAMLHAYAADVKSGAIKLRIKDGVELLDALCDQIVTSVGVGHMAGLDMVGGLKEVAASNASKFENGKPIRDKNLKILKGVNYFKPSLAQFAQRCRFLTGKAA